MVRGESLALDMDLLKSLVAVSDAGAITEAASRLGLTQPALTRRIQQLEEEFGTELLSRSRRGARLTELGQLVDIEARVLIGRYEHLKSEVLRRQSVSGGNVRIGGGATAVSFVLPDAITRFQSDYPDVLFQVKEAGSAEIAADVATGALELGLVTLPVRTTELEIQPIAEDHIVLVASPDHALAAMAEVDVLQLDGQNIVGFEAGSAIRQLVDSALLEAGIETNVVMELRSIPAIVQMVANTGSLAFVSQMGVQNQDLVRQIPVKGLEITRRLGLARRKATAISPAAEKFAQQFVTRDS